MPNTDERQFQTIQTVWSEITLQIRYEQHWLNSKTLPHVAHIEIRVVAPESAPLPITETGYKSHFCDRRVIEAAGGPVAYMLTWLDMAANTKQWREACATRRQLSLFS